MADLVGKVLGKYELVERLGSGGMSEVYKAYQPGPERYVAVKVLQSQWADDAQFVQRFKREAQAVARLRHANIIQLHDFDAAEGVFYMVMEYVEGDTLFERIDKSLERGQTLPLDEVARILNAVSGALDEAHSEGVVHRDIKPSNIIFTEDNTPVLTDFGIARVVSGDRQTRSGTVLGTAAYMSPEQVKGEAVDARSDIYALGVVLYEMVAGRVPFDAESTTAVIIKHVNESPTPPRTYNPDLPLAAQAVILRTLAKSPDDRPATAGELAQMWLESIPHAAPAPASSETVVIPETQPASESEDVAHKLPPRQDTFLAVGANRLLLPLSVGAILMLLLALIDLLQKLDPDLLTVIAIVVGLFSTLIFEFGEQLFGKNFSRQVALRLAALGAFIQRGIMVLSVVVILGSLAVLIVPRVFREDPAEAAIAHNAQGIALMQEGKTSDALVEFREAVALDPDLASAHYNLAWAYETLFNNEQAIAEYLLALEKDSGLDVAYNNLGRLYILEARYDQAITILRRGEENVANDARYALYKNLGWAYLGKMDTQKALGYLQTSLALRDDVADTHYLLGLVYEEMGESELAVEAFERFLDFADADVHLEWMDDARLRLEKLPQN